MKKFSLIILFLIVNTSVFGKQVSLADFAQKSKIKTIRISPDAKHIAYTYEEGTEVKLAIMEIKTKKGIYSFDVGPGREVVQFWWANNNRVGVLGGKITGWLDGAKKYYELISVNINGKKRKTLWDFQRAGVRLVSLLEDDPKNILVAKTHFMDKGGASLYKMNVNNGKMKYIADSPKAIGGRDAAIVAIVVDLDDVPRVGIERDPKDEDDFYDDIIKLHVKNVGGEWSYLDLPKIKKKPATVSPVGFNNDNSIFYFTSDYDSEQGGTNALFQYDFNSKKITKLFRNSDVSLGGSVTDSEGAFIGIAYDAGYRNYFYVSDKGAQAEIAYHKSIRASFKNQNINFMNYSKDRSKVTLHVYSDKNPGEFYILDRKNNSAQFLASSRPSIKAKEMAAVEPFSMNARDGLKMYGQLTIPNNKKLEKLPLVIYPHGGPYGVKDSWGWDSRAQMLASRGYLVLQLNFRGSGGYGEKFRDAGFKEWGAKMQDDLTDATHWAINQGYADKDRVCIHGVSYGGYASMQAVVREPNLYKCSIPDAGIYDVKTQWDNADTFKGGQTKAREKFYDRMFGKNRKLLIERSPAHNANIIKAKLLLVHGKDDVRVPIENAYFLEKKLKASGISYETIYKAKEGHGFHIIKNRIDLYERILKFLDKNIGH